MATIDLSVLSAAFLAGLLGSGHCFGMCGGIAAGLGAMSPGRGGWPALQFNLGRMGGYVLLGAIAGGALGAVEHLSDLKAIGRILRLITILMVAVIGLRFLLDWRGLDIIERGGAGLWRKVLPLASRLSQLHDWAGRLGLGLCWGFLPCGLVYTVLLTAAATGNYRSGALTMLAFGAGTLPAMLGLTLAAPALHAVLSDRLVRRIVGLSLLLLAGWMAVTLWAGMSHSHH